MELDQQNKVNNKSGGRGLIYQMDIAPGAIKQQHLVAYPVATGTIYYGNNGNFVNLGIGTTGQILQVVSGVPAWTSFIPPKYTTTARNAITSPVAGMIIYNTTTNKLNVYTTGWEAITSA